MKFEKTAYITAIQSELSQITWADMMLKKSTTDNHVVVELDKVLSWFNIITGLGFDCEEGSRVLHT